MFHFACLCAFISVEFRKATSLTWGISQFGDFGVSTEFCAFGEFFCAFSIPGSVEQAHFCLQIK